MGISKSMGITVLSAGLISLSIECLQELLPEAFERGFAMSDIVTSLGGGLVGGIVATVLGRAAAIRAD